MNKILTIGAILAITAAIPALSSISLVQNMEVFAQTQQAESRVCPEGSGATLEKGKCVYQPKLIIEDCPLGSHHVRLPEGEFCQNDETGELNQIGDAEATCPFGGDINENGLCETRPYGGPLGDNDEEG
jgi:hypothetical protein